MDNNVYYDDSSYEEITFLKLESIAWNKYISAQNIKDKVRKKRRIMAEKKREYRLRKCRIIA